MRERKEGGEGGKTITDGKSNRGRRQQQQQRHVAEEEEEACTWYVDPLALLRRVRCRHRVDGVGEKRRRAINIPTKYWWQTESARRGLPKKKAPRRSSNKVTNLALGRVEGQFRTSGNTLSHKGLLFAA